MRVKLLTGMAGAHFCHEAGDIVDAPTVQAQTWIDRGIAAPTPADDGGEVRALRHDLDALRADFDRLAAAVAANAGLQLTLPTAASLGAAAGADPIHRIPGRKPIMLRDQATNIHPLPAIPPVAAITDNTALVSSIIDTQGYESLTFLIATGAEVDADATFTVSMTHGDQANLSDGAAVAATDLIGTLALASFDFSADNKTRKVGYIGTHRYVQMTITPANNTGSFFASAIALLGNPHNAPTPNPPV